jgi:hypothetical protein
MMKPRKHTLDTVQIAILGTGIFLGGCLTGFYHGTVREMKQCENVMRVTEQAATTDELLKQIQQIPPVAPVEPLSDEETTNKEKSE